MNIQPFFRGRRLRRSDVIREMTREVSLAPQNFIMPYFAAESSEKGFRKAIGSMPGQFQLGLDELVREMEPAVKAGLRSCLLFGIPAEKDEAGKGAYAENGIVQRAVRLVKKEFPHVQVVTDVCLCEYTSHGHCGLLAPSGEVRNDPTLHLLAQTALSHVEAGADMVAPSDMMDGRVAAVREELDLHGHTDLPIMSYAVKYASAFYGPFREAAESAPKSGNRKSYQMDPARRREALLEAGADIDEGADIIMVKPAGPYLDIIREVRDAFDVPVAAYQVSGEYSCIEAAARNGWIDRDAVMLESLTAIRRAGADIIMSYFTQDMLVRGLLR